jgi:Zn-dependent protease with chaperone function
MSASDATPGATPGTTPRGQAGAALAADYFDGTSSRAHAVRLTVQGASLHIEGDGISRTHPLAGVRWPERTRHGARIAHLPGGGSLHGADAAAWDAWAGAAGLRDGLVVRTQRSWRATAAALLAVVLLCAAGYRWGLPMAASAALAFVPESIDRELGRVALDRLVERRWLQPTELAPAEQQRLRAAFARAVAKADANRGTPAHELRFHKSALGPNALALPGGVIVLTDEMVALVDAREDVLVGVLAHELGHVRHRHGMRLVTQAALLGAATGVLYGDFSALLAGVPALLGHLDYSRHFEREADLEALRVLRANGMAPQGMVLLFERLARQRGQSRVPIALASHPDDAERVRLFGGGGAR